MTGLSTGWRAGQNVRGGVLGCAGPLLEKIGKRPLRDLTAGEVEAALRESGTNWGRRPLVGRGFWLKARLSADLSDTRIRVAPGIPFGPAPSITSQTCLRCRAPMTGA